MCRIRLEAGMVLSLLIFASFTLGACRSQKEKIEVTVMADFGPANRPLLQKRVAVPERSTVFEALRTAFPVQTSAR